ncbi:MAG: hypothetical protein M3466_16435, partial [Gemmatimonadota bacterium]|nr:hypothetical protein [Gemmatimonadota bacterium]
MLDIESFAPAIRALPELPEGAQYTPADLMVPQFQIAAERHLRMYYVPFGTINSDARVAIVGITPGWTQMEIAYRVVRKELIAGTAAEEACRRAKFEASFAGSMRTNLISMLDLLGLPALLGLTSSADLFDSAPYLVHTTSAIRYPVFNGDRNYTGSNPHPLKSPLLMGT